MTNLAKALRDTTPSELAENGAVQLCLCPGYHPCHPTTQPLDKSR